jgi:hypothetical protein
METTENKFMPAQRGGETGCLHGGSFYRFGVRELVTAFFCVISAFRLKKESDAESSHSIFGVIWLEVQTVAGDGICRSRLMFGRDSTAPDPLRQVAEPCQSDSFVRLDDLFSMPDW